MGLFDYFKRRRQRESAIPQGDVVSGDVGSTPVPAAQPQPAPGAPNVPPGGVAVTMTPEIMQQMAGLQRLMSAHEVNLREQPMEVRQAVAGDLQAKGINAQVGGALQITDPQQIHDVVQVLKDHGLLPPNVTVN
jgi:hypothetical protein